MNWFQEAVIKSVKTRYAVQSEPQCKACGQDLPEVGFQRSLVTRGLKKGSSKVKVFYGECPCKLAVDKESRIA